MTLEIDTRDNDILASVEDHANDTERVRQHWACANTMAVDRLQYSDHGEKHVEIVANHALNILRLLEDAETPSIVEDYDMSFADAEVVVALAGLLHDVGHIVHRYHHSEYGLSIAPDLIVELLEPHYTDRELVIMKSEILHAIQAHHRKATPLTLEAGILRVADALDMEKGRARAPVEQGDRSIHSVSALSIEEVSVSRGEETPLRIDIRMSNSAGIFQLDELARGKIEGSGLEDLVTLRADIAGGADVEEKLLEEYEL